MITVADEQRSAGSTARSTATDEVTVPGPLHLRPRGDSVFQLTLSVVVVVGSWLSLWPLGVTGPAGLTLALLLINSVLIFYRNVPGALVSSRIEMVLLISWGVAAAGLLALHSLGFAAAFAYVAAGQVGYRLSARTAVAVAAMIGVLSCVFLLGTAHRGVAGWPWALGLTVSLPVFIGMANRSRDAAVASALAAAAAAQRAAESEARATALVERARISRDIHDVLAHSLSGISMQLELSDMFLEVDNIAGARDAIGKAHSLVREGMTEARRAVQNSRSEVLPLARTLHSLFSTATDLQVMGRIRDLPTEVTQALVRAGQESLTNCRRHAPGAGITATLTYRDDQVELAVGNGPSSRDGLVGSGGSGMGLVGMRERVALLDGRVEAGPITAGPMTGGWLVTVTLPV